ncbi:MAG: hypothetical protein GXO49_05800 [Chlorobi bacterium]|nr:hypothetical protein [Chlorobiota bacterium]
MNKFILIFIFNVIFFSSFSQENKKFGTDDNNIEAEYSFSIRLLPSMGNNLFQCAIIKNNAPLKGNIEYLNVNDWILQAAGYEKSLANPNNENLFAKYNVFEVPEVAKNKGDSEIKYYTINKAKAIFNNLWRLKYSEYPYFNPKLNNEKGWAQHPDPQITWLPSESQMNILRTSFGIHELSDFIVGENAFKLLKDIRDRNWQNRYIQSAGGYTVNNDTTNN